MRSYVKALATNHYFVHLDVTVLFSDLFAGPTMGIVQIGSDTAVTVMWVLVNESPGESAFSIKDASDATLSRRWLAARASSSPSHDSNVSPTTPSSRCSRAKSVGWIRLRLATRCVASRATK